MHCLRTYRYVKIHATFPHLLLWDSVGNMPGAVARTSTFTLTNATMPYMVDLANKGWKKACQDDKALARGINTYDGKVYFKGVSDALGYELHCTCDILK